MKEPVDHILRPKLPWRTDEAAITECGYNAVKVPTITREQALQRYKDYGRQRMAMMTCMTCIDTANRWGTWTDDPRKAIEREITWECQWRRSDHGARLRDELNAIAALIDDHPDEFERLVIDSSKRREWLEKKAAMQSRDK